MSLKSIMTRGALISRNGIDYTVLEFTDGPWIPSYTGPMEMVLAYEHSSLDHDNPRWLDASEFQLVNSIQKERACTIRMIRSVVFCLGKTRPQARQNLTEVADIIERGEHNENEEDFK